MDNQEFHEEEIGNCQTNPTKDSQHCQSVDPKYLWSYAQEEALVALSEQGGDKQWRLIADPERRAKRIAARYANLYFDSNDKSQGSVQFFWPALAAFVVKDIVEAFRYGREEVLSGGWRNATRTSTLSSLVSDVFTDASPYEHAMRVYAALAKGNLWLFMDVYPWYWFFMEYGINKDGSINKDRLNSHVGERDAEKFQDQSKKATIGLPFGAQWLGVQGPKQESDPVYQAGSQFFDTPPVWGGMDGGYGAHQGAVFQADRYVKAHLGDDPTIYRMPLAPYWSSFAEPFYVLDEAHRELLRVAHDGAAAARFAPIATFRVKPDVRSAYSTMMSEGDVADPSAKAAKQLDELNFVAKHEQLDVLQPVIYADEKLVKTMNVNHFFSRWSFGWLSPQYAVVYSSQPSTKDASLKTVFDAPSGIGDYFSGRKKSLPNPTDRMEYVGQIAKDFNRLMRSRSSYMESELKKIAGWKNA